MAGPGPELPPGGAGAGVGMPGQGGPGGQSAQIVQQIEGLLAQLAQEEPDPQIQRLIKQVQAPIEALQQAAGADDMQDMQSGLANPGGAGGGEPGGGGGGEHHVVEIHIGAGGPKDFKSANKAAMSTMGARGHFSRETPSGEEPETQKARYRAGKK